MAHRFRTTDRNSPAARQRAADYSSRQHRQLRKQWEPILATHGAYCRELECVHRTRWMPPGSPFHLAHTPDRRGYLGPAHPECNLRAAARAGNAKQRANHPPRRRAQSRAW